LPLKLLAALNILFFLSFLLVALFAAGKAHAETVACGGTDLMDSMRRSDPAAYRRIEDEAAKVVNGKSRFWKLERKGSPPSFLLGTMHLSDARVTELPRKAQAAFDKAGTVVIETTDALDQKKIMDLFWKEPQLMMFTDGTTLLSLLSPQQVATVKAALDLRGIPFAAVVKMKPWLLGTFLEMPPCELARHASGLAVLDEKLGKEAVAHGKKLEGLETAADQLRAMDSLPLSFHINGLVDTLALGDKLADVNTTMIDLYVKGDIGAIWPMLRAVSPGDAQDPTGYAAFQQTMIDARNKAMVEHAGPILARGNAFIAVGALHLPGPNGLVERFRRAGYTVTAVD
jgi:uncharacterized protein YbaP (TraB family)